MEESEKVEDWKPGVLIIGSGAIKGMMYVGALIELEKMGVLDDVEVYVGVSVGAVISLLLCLGYPAENIATIGKNTDVFKVGVENIGTGFVGLASTIGHIFQKVVNEMGIYDKSCLEQPLIDLCRNKLGYVPTLEQLYQFSGKELHTVTYCGETKQKVIMSRHNFPDILCTDAVVCSSLVPVLISRKQYKGLTYYDGYFSDPYPIEDYDRDGKKILGIYLNQHYDLSKHIDYILAPLSSYQDMKINESVKNSSINVRHLKIDFKGDSSESFISSLDVKERMLENGKSIAISFIRNIRDGVMVKVYNGPIS